LGRGKGRATGRRGWETERQGIGGRRSGGEGKGMLGGRHFCKQKFTNAPLLVASVVSVVNFSM